MVRAPAVLAVPGVAPRQRVAAGTALVAVLAAYYALHEELWSASLGWDVAFLALVLLPALFALPLLALPARTARWLPLAAAMLVVGAVVADVTGAAVPGALLKLGASTALGYLFGSLFESVLWVAAIALIVPWIDAWSVWNGPTKHLVTQRREIFTSFSIPFPLPGEHAAAALGLPDFLFFAVFLCSAAKFGLRVRLTWLAMTLSFGVTIVLAAYTAIFGAAGLPALPLLCVAFLLANADLLAKAFRRRRPVAGT